MNRRWIHTAWLLLLIVVFVVWYIQNQQPPPPPRGPGIPPAQPGAQGPDANAQMRWGNPSKSKADISDRNNYLMEKRYFTLSYNDANGTPNWVSWRVVPADLGTAARFPFTADPELPAGFKKITTEDYQGSGFDRGHMCDHADRQSDVDASKATFVMTNIVPQSAANNEKGWEQFESYCRSLVKQGKELYIVAGPVGRGGESRGHSLDVIHGKAGDIVVPAKTWKVVMVLNPGEAPNGNMRLIAVVMPNDETVDDHWEKYRTSVRAVEQMTGYTFFDRVDPAVIGPLKEKTDDLAVPPPISHGR